MFYGLSVLFADSIAIIGPLLIIAAEGPLVFRLLTQRRLAPICQCRFCRPRLRPKSGELTHADFSTMFRRNAFESVNRSEANERQENRSPRLRAVTPILPSS